MACKFAVKIKPPTCVIRTSNKDSNRPLFMLSLAASIGPASASKLAARNGLGRTISTSTVPYIQIKVHNGLIQWSKLHTPHAVRSITFSRPTNSMHVSHRCIPLTPQVCIMNYYFTTTLSAVLSRNAGTHEGAAVTVHHCPCRINSTSRR